MHEYTLRRYRDQDGQSEGGNGQEILDLLFLDFPCFPLPPDFGRISDFLTSFSTWTPFLNRVSTTTSLVNNPLLFSFSKERKKGEREEARQNNKHSAYLCINEGA